MAPKLRNPFSKKKRKTTKGPGETSRQTRNTDPMQEDSSPEHCEEHQTRLQTLRTRRILSTTIWIDIPTLNELGLYNSVKSLIERIGLCDFLCDEVPTYEGITLEFLSTVEFSRATNLINFCLGGHNYEHTSTQIMEILNLPFDNVAFMNDTCTFHADMTEKRFKELICEEGYLNPQRVWSMKHPTLRYIQRVLALSLFGRGETISVFRKPDLLYLYCMLRRNNEEMHFQPHFGYYLAKHLHTAAIEHRPNGKIRVGGIIAKIARGLQINMADRMLGGSTTLDIAGLVHMQLIKKSVQGDYWVSDGPGDYGYHLPLNADIDPNNRSTWILEQEPEVEEEDPRVTAIQVAAAIQAEAAAQDLTASQADAAIQGQAGPSNQDLMNYMVELNTSWNERFAILTTDFNAQFKALHLRLDDLRTPLYNAEEDTQIGRWFSQQTYEHASFEPTEDPPTPRRERRRRQAQQQEEYQAAQRAQQEAQQ